LTKVQQYDGTGISLTGLDGNTVAGVFDTDHAGALRGLATAEFDDQGRVFATHTFSVDPSSGSVGASIDSGTWFDSRGEVIKTATSGQASTKYGYDGAGRNTAVFSVVLVANESNSNAASVDLNIVLSQTETQFDKNGNPVFAISKARFHDDSDSALGTLGSPTNGVPERISYAGVFYDAANRSLASVDWGTNGDTPLTLPGTVPSNSATVHVTTFGYDAAGNLSTVTDPAGIVTKRSFDALGRATNTIQGFTNGVPTALSNHTTQFTYNGDDQILTQTNLLPCSQQQQTQYVYGARATNGSAVNVNNLLASVQTTDPLIGTTPPAVLSASYAYNALGETATQTDNFGNTHFYGHDSLGRMTVDKLTALGTNQDGSIRQVVYGFDSAGNNNSITGYAGTGSIGSQSAISTTSRTFNGFGQVTGETQTQLGGATQTASYTYADASLGSRLTGISDSMHRVLAYNYTGAIDSGVSRLTSISQGTGSNQIALASYLYLGDGTVVRKTDQNGIALSYFDSSITSGDKYTGLDRFGQTVNEKWISTALGGQTSIASYQFTYDGAGRVTSKQNADGSKDQYTYNVLGLSGISNGNNSAHSGGGVGVTPQYDSSGRLVGSTSTLGSDSTGYSAAASGSYDSLGRLRGFTETTTQSGATNTTSQSIGYNDAGKLSSVSQNQLAGASVAYEYISNDGTASAGKLSAIKVMQGTTMLSETDYTYDTSGRLHTVTARSGTQTAQTFTYGYTSNNLISSVTRSGGPTTTLAYTTTSNSDQLSSITTATTGTSSATVYAMSYGGFNAKGQATGATVSQSGSSDTTWAYTYDAQGQLTAASATGGTSASYAYTFDAAGNRTDLGTVNADNQYGSFTYDARGNLTDDGTKTYTYDPMDRLTSVTPDSPTTGSIKVTMGYDSQGRRAWKKSFAWNTGTSAWATTPSTYLKFAYDGMNLVAEFTSNGTTDTLLQTYAWNPNATGGVGGLLSITDYRTSTPKTYLPFYDGNGNVTGLTDAASGSIVATYSYDPFGNLTASGGIAAAANPFRFSTKYFDSETGLYYYGYRLYSPAQNRFITRDPSGEINGGPNLYAFVGNDPINGIDQFGLNPEEYDSTLDGNNIRAKEFRISKEEFDRLGGDQILIPGGTIGWNDKWPEIVITTKPKLRTEYANGFTRLLCNLGSFFAGGPWISSEKAAAGDYYVFNAHEAQGKKKASYTDAAIIFHANIESDFRNEIFRQIDEHAADTAMDFGFAAGANIVGGALNFKSAFGDWTGAAGGASPFRTKPYVPKWNDFSAKGEGFLRRTGKGTHMAEPMMNMRLRDESLKIMRCKLSDAGFTELQQTAESGRITFQKTERLATGERRQYIVHFDPNDAGGPNWHKYVVDTHGQMWELNDRGYVAASGAGNPDPRVHIPGRR
jgi:RHS repeat-associated protein